MTLIIFFKRREYFKRSGGCATGIDHFSVSLKLAIPQM